MNTPNPSRTATKIPIPMLQKSVHLFLTEFRSGNSNPVALCSDFTSAFQTCQDPPLEATWFNSALSYHDSKSAVTDPSKGLSIVNELYQSLISGCSGYDDSRKVAALVPVLYELYNLLLVPQSCPRKEIRDFVEVILDYIKVHRSNRSKAKFACFSDLVLVWMVDRIDKNTAFEDLLQMCLPLMNREMCVRLVDNEVGYMAGIVMIEAFLLRFCLEPGTSLPDDDVRKWVVQIIQGFSSYYFLELLFRLLLEPCLPITTISSPEDELLIRRLLYDAVIFEGYSFIYSGNLNDQPNEFAPKDLSLLWLFVADTAIRFISQNGDTESATKYTDAFAVSEVPVQLMKWVTSKFVDDSIRAPKISTPNALIKWLQVIRKLKIINQSDYDEYLFYRDNMNQRGESSGNVEGQEMVDDATRKSQETAK